MARDDLTFIDIADFTPGIHSNYITHTGQAAGEPRPDGAAQEAGTYGCVAIPTGGLKPLPTWVVEREGTAFFSNIEGADIVTTGDPDAPSVYFDRIVTLDARVIGPIEFIPPFTETVDYSLPPTDHFMVRQTWGRRVPGGTAEPYWFFSNHREFLGPSYTRDGLANYGLIDLTSSARTIIPNRWRYGCGSIAETRTVPAGADTAEVGDPIVVAGMGGVRVMGGVKAADPEGTDTYVYVTYPDRQSSDPIDGPRALPHHVGSTYNPACMILGHQGRLVGLLRVSGYKRLHKHTYHGDDYGHVSPSDDVIYWGPNNVYDSTDPVVLATFVEEVASGYGTACSVSADSLFLVKHVGGAVMVNGDLDNPTVVRLPGIPSTGGVTNRGVMTDRGYIYGTTSGAWLWTGSDTAEFLSPQLTPEFWIPDDPTIPFHEREASLGSWAFDYPYVYGPNNWMLDTRTGGWWRYAPTPDQEAAGIATDALTFAFNEVSGDRLHAFVKSYTQPGAYIRIFDKDTLTSTWRWQSQPLARTRNRYLTYRQLTAIATGAGTFDFTLRGVDGTSQTVSMTVDSERVAQVVLPLSVYTTDVELTIVATGVDSGPAPTLHRVSLGYREQQGIDAAGTLRGN